ncbi:MAG: hypothetical protein IPM34_02275 [Saprospiraceae bacterium]|nr:hypothetical protein [Saprospiraceae bacterium]
MNTRSLFQFLIVVFLFGALNLEAQTQGQSEVIQDWSKMHDSHPDLDIYSSLVQCDGKLTFLLKIKNNSTIAKQARFRLDVFNNSTGQKISTQISSLIESLVEIQAICGESDHSNLQIELPEGFDPKSLYSAITF